MSRKVFISCLGTGPYTPCRYQLSPEKTSTRVYFVQEALISLLCNKWEEQDKIFIFCTPEAEKTHWQDSKKNDFKGLKQSLDNLQLKASIEKVFIPTGQSEEELMKIFNSFFNKLKEKDQVILDITHAFRYIPLLAPLALNYAKMIKEITVKGIYYGAFEVLGKEKAENLPEDECIAPIFDLTHYSQLFDWSRAVDIFLQSGDTKLLSALARQELKSVFQNDPRQTHKLSKFFNFLNNFSSNIFTVREENLRNTNFALLKEISNIDYSLYKLPLAPLLEKIENKLAPFIDKDKCLPIEAARWCIQHNLLAQAYIFLFEGVLTELCIMHKEDIKKEKNRNFWSSFLKYIISTEDKKNTWKCDLKDKEKYEQEVLKGGDALKNLAKAVDGLRKKRNDYMHAGCNEGATNKPHKLIENINNHLQEIEKALREYKQSYSKNITKLKKVPQAKCVKKAFLIFSHQLTSDQIKDLEQEWQVQKIIELPSDLYGLWTSIPPDLSSLKEYLKPLFNWLKQEMSGQDIAIVQGDFGATLAVVSFLKERGNKALYATTKRVVEEKALSDGKVIQKRVFKHVCFREYELF